MKDIPKYSYELDDNFIKTQIQKWEELKKKRGILLGRNKVYTDQQELKEDISILGTKIETSQSPTERHLIDYIPEVDRKIFTGTRKR